MNAHAESGASGRAAKVCVEVSSLQEGEHSKWLPMVGRVGAADVNRQLQRLRLCRHSCGLSSNHICHSLQH